MTELFYRAAELRASDLGDDGVIRLVASTDAAVNMGGFREILVHKDGSIDHSSARSLLLNHDRDQIIGGVRSVEIHPGEMHATVFIAESARTAAGTSIRELVKLGALRGVSIGYTYDREGARYDEVSNTVTADKWMLREITLTPTPADTRAHVVRSLPNHFAKAEATISGSPVIENRAAPAAEHKEAIMADEIKPQEKTPDAAPKNDDGAVRAAVIAEQREIAAQAKSLDLDASAFVGLNRESAKDAMIRALAEKNKTPAPKAAAVPASIDYDQSDKARDAFAGALAYRAGFRSGEFAELQKGNPLLGQGLQHSVRRYARLMGLNTEDWSNRDVAYFAFGHPEMMAQHAQRAANVTSSMFPNFVFLNALTKIVAKGYEQGSATARYKQIVDTQTVPDFKQFSIGALSASNLVKTAENAAFPELDKAEGVYNSTAKMWGGTLSWTIQAMVNDDTSQLDRNLRMAGPIADKTIDRRVFQKLLMGTSSDEGTSTWTSNTSSGGSLVYTTADLGAAARGKLAIVRAAMMNKVGLDGNPIGAMPRFLLCGPTREVEAQAIVGNNGPALQAGSVQQALSGLQVVSSPWLEASALTGYSTTSYYLLADPMDVTGLILTKISGFENIQVTPFDPGAAAALNYKLWIPFEADLHYLTVGSTATIAAAQQGTT